LIYWIDVAFQYCEHFIEFTSLDIKYIDRQLILELIKILKFFKIKKKFLEIIIDNASNNDTFKDKFDKVLNRRESQ